jgi:hypothetical protein
MSIIPKERRIVTSPDVLNWRAGDTLPGIVVRVLGDGNKPIDLTGAKCFMAIRRVSGVPTSAQWLEDTGFDWSRPREVLAILPREGVVYYDVQPEDTNVPPGEFDLTIKIHYTTETGVRSVTAPSLDTSRLVIRDALEMID